MVSVPRQLLLVVEGTAALGQHWELLRTEYLDKIIKSFCDGENSNQNTSGFVAEMALVVFYTHGPYSGCLVQQTGWTTNLDRFWQWVSSINFAGGGFGDAAIAEGLAEALLMCCPNPVANPVSQVAERQKHCILLAASNPHRLPTPIPRPPVQGLPQPSTSSDPSTAEHWWLAEADTVAKAFSKCSVSLSVISPRQLLSLKSIFNEANRTARAPETPIEVSKYVHHMVLISDNFAEARQALIHSSGGPTAVVPPVVLPKVEASSATSLPSAAQAPPGTLRAPTAGLVAGRPSTANGIIPTVALKSEVSSVPGMAASGVTHVTPSTVMQNSVPVPLSMPHSSSTQDSSVVADSSMVQEFKSIGAPSLRAGLAVAGNLSLLPTSSQARPILGTVGNSLGIPGGTISAGGLTIPGMLSSSSASGAVSSSQTLLGAPPSGLGLTNSQVGMGVGQGVGIGAFNNAGNLVGNSNLGAVPAGGSGNSSVSNMQVVGMGQSITGLTQGNLSAGTTQIGPNGLVMGGQNVLPALGSVAVNPSPPTMIPTPGIAQPVQGLQQMGAVTNNTLQTMGAVNNNALQVPAAVATPPQQPNAGPKYSKIWEGFLTGHRQGKPVSICKLEAYRQASSPETYASIQDGLAADWPNQMQIIRLIPQDHMHSKNYQGKSEVLIFRTVGQHGQQGFLVQLAEKKLCAVIQLPSQTLLLASTDVKKQDRMLGMLFPGDMVVFKPQGTSQQQQQQLQQPALSTGSAITQAFSPQGQQLSNQVRPQLLQPGQLQGQGPGTGFMQ